MTLSDLDWPFHIVHTKISIIRIARYAISAVAELLVISVRSRMYFVVFITE